MLTKSKNTLEYLVSPLISVPHGFTTRRGGVSTGVTASLNLALGHGDTIENVEENLHRLAAAIGFAPERLVLTHQIHSAIVRVVTERDCLGLCHLDYPECDALVTATPGIALLAYTADCTPLLLWDPITGAVGAVHAGWRGTAKDIAGETVRTMVAAFGCRPENLRAAIGPNIGLCHFETDGDVPAAMRDTFGAAAEAYIQQTGSKFHVDLKGMNAWALRRAGVDRVDLAAECTMCSPDRFWSNRVTHGRRGSQGAVIVCGEARQ